MKTYNWGIIGAGHIAGQFAGDLKMLPNARLKAIASRSSLRAADFAERFDIPLHYGTWEEMAENRDIDIVYVATYHPDHYQNTLNCLKAGKAVLCEKPFTMNRTELESLVHASRKKKVFLMEAIWTRFLPSTLKVLEIAEKNELGELVHVYADFGFRKEFDPSHRLYDPAKGGGALLDIGIYPVFIARLMAGRPVKIMARASFAINGVDQEVNMVFEHENGVSSSLNCTLAADTPTEANIIFEKGWIRMESWWLTPGPITVHREGHAPERVDFDEPGNGYHYEATEVMNCLDSGLTESPLLPLDFSLSLMETLDQVRDICGIHYT
jgi:predicted dehydrogenase